MPIQQMLLGVGASKKTYMDDVFSTHVYRGTSSTQTINNGINLSGEGGLVWSFGRDTSWGPYMVDTERGAALNIHSSNQDAEDMNTAAVTGFNTNGYSLGADGSGGLVNYNTKKYVSWTFRKAKGFFDIVTYTGNGSARTIAHSLGSVPGMIMVKKTNSTGSWAVYHRDLSAATHYLVLNGTSEGANNTNIWNGTHPTSTHFSVGTDTDVNGNNDEFIAYVFAGGESTEATANSVDFDGSGDYLTTNSSSDYTPGTSDFTLEYWYKPDENAVDFLVDASGGSEIWGTYCNASGIHKYRVEGTDRIVSTSSLIPGQWYHIAVVRISNTVTMYINGIPEGGTYNDTTNYTFNHLHIGRRASDGSYEYNGKISNLRWVVGTGVYTSAFRPPTEPLTNITNTKLLCCNSSSVTGATVGTITSNGDPTASTDSPFDDSTAFKFGNSKEGIIKSGSYVGNGSATGPKINIGWEPQWLLIKNASSADNWHLIDSMRGIVSGADDKYFTINTNSSESDYDFGDLTPTGFQLRQDNLAHNNDGDTYVYLAIRRPDGYVGKPADAGTDVFAMDTGASSSTIPNFDSGFPVDFQLMRRPATAENWYSGARLTQGKYGKLNLTDAESSQNDWVFDSNTGWNDGGYANTYQSWMWKRHAGFDVLAYTGTGVTGHVIPHQMGRAPEMMWIKNRDSAVAWRVFHIGHGGGTNADQYGGELNNNVVPHSSDLWFEGNPTSTHITLKTSSLVNGSGAKYAAMLFASVDGISKVGYYTGTGSTQTITTGFQPRFVIIKRTNAAHNWMVFDTVRGWGSGTDQYLKLDTDESQGAADLGQPVSTGFEVGSDPTVGANNDTYIYYAHA